MLPTNSWMILRNLQKLTLLFSLTIAAENATHSDLPTEFQALKVE